MATSSEGGGSASILHFSSATNETIFTSDTSFQFLPQSDLSRRHNIWVGFKAKICNSNRLSSRFEVFQCLIETIK